MLLQSVELIFLRHVDYIWRVSDSNMPAIFVLSGPYNHESIDSVHYAMCFQLYKHELDSPSITLFFLIRKSP